MQIPATGYVRMQVTGRMKQNNMQYTDDVSGGGGARYRDIGSIYAFVRDLYERQSCDAGSGMHKNANVSCKRRGRTEDSILEGTRTLFRYIVTDLVQCGPVSDKPDGAVSDCTRAVQAAERKAEKILLSLGVKKKEEAGKVTEYILPGGFLESHISKSIINLSRDGFTSAPYTESLLWCAKMPKHIAASARDIKKAAHAVSLGFDRLSACKQFRMADRSGSGKPAPDVYTVIANGRAVIKTLNLMIYPDDILDAGVRHHQYDCLVGTALDMDRALMPLLPLVRPSRDRDDGTVAVIHDIFSAACTYCTYAVFLADAFFRALGPRFREREHVCEPCKIELEARKRYREMTGSGEKPSCEMPFRELSVPARLFSKDAGDHNITVLNSIKNHVSRVDYIKNSYKRYIDIIGTDVFDMTESDRKFFFSMQDSIRNIIEKNVDLLMINRRRMKMSGRTGGQNSTFAQTVTRQNRVLLKWYYPGLAGRDSMCA